MFGRLQPLELIMLAATFGLIFSLWLVGLALWNVRRSARERKVEQRLGVRPPESGTSRELSLWVDGRLAQTRVPGGKQRLTFRERVDRLQEQAGLETSPAALILGWIGLAMVGFFAGLVLGKNLTLGLGAGVAVALGLWFYLGHRIAQRAALFDQQFADALGLAARSLRAGHPLIGAFQLVAEEMNPPVSQLFANICQHQALGMALEETIRRAALRGNSEDFKLFATAVIIQLRTGGNLADMMDRLCVVIRERMRLGRRIRVLTAQTHMSKTALSAMPFIVFFILTILNPAYIATLYTTTTGQVLIGIALVGIGLGIWVMNRMSVLRY